MKTIIVASTNPVKINATKEAFSQVFSREQFDCIGKEYPSGVAEQPMTNGEARLGAVNRAQRAKEANPDAAYCVGLEGGIEMIDHDMYAYGWNAIINKAGFISTTKSAIFLLPDITKEKVLSGTELGPASAEIHNKQNVKQTSGTVGILTNGIIDRTALYVHPMILALIPFVNSDLYQ